MSAAASRATVPLYEEGKQFWDEVVRECERQATEINSVLSQRGLPDCDCLQVDADTRLSVLRSAMPSTELQAAMEFRPWGPVINGFVNGLEAEDLRFFPEEFEMSIAKDLDGEVVAVFDEGRSLSSRQLATYMIQHFRRCFPGISLPCPE